MVLVRVYGLLREKLGWSAKRVVVRDDCKVLDLFESIEDLRPLIPLIENGEVMVLVNGINIRLLHGLETKISNEDTVDVFPPGGGG